MTKDEIRAERDRFIEYPSDSNKMYVTTVSALCFSEHIVNIAIAKDREECAKVCEKIISEGIFTLNKYAEAIRARGEK